MKTTKQWLESLPEPYRSEALNNADPRVLVKESTDSLLSEALISSFTWSTSSQGFNYWKKLHYSLLESECKTI